MARSRPVPLSPRERALERGAGTCLRVERKQVRCLSSQEKMPLPPPPSPLLPATKKCRKDREYLCHPERSEPVAGPPRAARLQRGGVFCQFGCRIDAGNPGHIHPRKDFCAMSHTRAIDEQGVPGREIRGARQPAPVAPASFPGFPPSRARHTGAGMTEGCNDAGQHPECSWTRR